MLAFAMVTVVALSELVAVKRPQRRAQRRGLADVEGEDVRVVHVGHNLEDVAVPGTAARRVTA